MNTALPVVVIGAGPVGLAAAVHLLDRGFTPLVLEAGDSVGAGMLQWSQVRMFSPWEYTIDKPSAAVLRRHGWTSPALDAFPTGREVVERYLRPLAETPELAPHVRLGSRVVSVVKHRRDRMKDAERNEVPFLVRYSNAQGEHDVLAQAVVDASGTIETPNPLGASGVPAMGERAVQDRIFYGMPDVRGSQRARYAGKRVLVVGSGHSAFNVLSDLAQLANDAPGTTIQWAIRRPSVKRVLGGGASDQLQERGRLGLTIGRLLERGALTVATDFHLDRLESTPTGIVAHGSRGALPPVDEIVAATGFRPDLTLLSELRIALDLGTQSPATLAPLIDPNLHSCGSVRPHGAEELKHPDANVYIVGMKSYGRAPTFLLLTGYEQVRSVVAAIAGDWDAARRVELVLPETGVCITQFDDEAATPASCCAPPSNSVTASAVAAPVAVASTAGCCGGPPQADAAACCVKDEVAKAAGEAGCGCSVPSAPVTTAVAPAVAPAPAKVSACCR